MNLLVFIALAPFPDSFGADQLVDPFPINAPVGSGFTAPATLSKPASENASSPLKPDDPMASASISITELAIFIRINFGKILLMKSFIVNTFCIL